MKNATITSVFKFEDITAGEQQQTHQYTLSPDAEKVLEQQLIAHLDFEATPHQVQFGFRIIHSNETAMLLLHRADYD